MLTTFLKKKRRRWFLHFALPLHLLTLSITLAADDDIRKCAFDLGDALQKKIAEAESFFSRNPIELDAGIESFVQSRDAWHVEFKDLLTTVDRGFEGFVSAQDEGMCNELHPTIFALFDGFALAALVVLACWFLYQDLRTPLGASRRVVFVASNVLLSIFSSLLVLNLPVAHVVGRAVRLSEALEGALHTLKETQRDIVGTPGRSLRDFDCLAQIWDGKRLGVPLPLSGLVLDVATAKDLSRWAFRAGGMLALAGGFLAYRASVKSLVQWRRAIPSCVCIAVVFPHKKVLWRIGSGCIVSASRGMILTNWHLFQELINSSEITPSTSTSPPPQLRTTSSSSSASFSSTPTPAPPPSSSSRRLHRHLRNPRRFASSFVEAHAGVRIFIGTTTRGHPEWVYEAEIIPGAESPASDFTPFGLDLCVLRIVARVSFEGLNPLDAGSLVTHAPPSASDSAASGPASVRPLTRGRRASSNALLLAEASAAAIGVSYAFARVERVAIESDEAMRAEELSAFELGDPGALRAGESKLRVLGYPASGGLGLSVITGYFTGCSFDYNIQRRGAWLNVNQHLPHGGSGGAAVNAAGELVGVATQTRGGFSNIRSVSEAAALLRAAKRHLSAADAKGERDVDSELAAAAEDCPAAANACKLLSEIRCSLGGVGAVEGAVGGAEPRVSPVNNPVVGVTSALYSAS